MGDPRRSHGPQLTRRTVVKGAGWATPAIAMATAAPAFAASPAACPAMPSGTAWTTVRTPNANASAATWNGTTFTMFADAPNGTPATLTTSSTVTFQQGYSYGLQFIAQAAKGYRGSGTCATVNTSVQIQIVAPNGTATPLFQGHTQSGPRSLVAPPPNCTAGGTRVSAFGSNSTAGATLTPTPVATYVAQAAGTYTLQLVFTIDASDQGNNDDWRITPSFTACSTP